jgi:transcriptional regulator with XRE-family HTH domain
MIGGMSTGDTDGRARLGELVAARRTELGLSQSAAAALADMDRRTWSDIEKNQRATEDYNLVKVEIPLRWPPGTVRAILEGREPGPHRRDGQPTELGLFLLDAMTRRRPPLGQADLAALAGVDVSTLNGWMYHGAQPSATHLRALVDVLGPDSRADPVIRELTDLLGERSPLPVEDRAALRRLLDVALAPYRQMADRRRSA